MILFIGVKLNTYQSKKQSLRLQEVCTISRTEFEVNMKYMASAGNVGRVSAGKHATGGAGKHATGGKRGKTRNGSQARAGKLVTG